MIHKFDIMWCHARSIDGAQFAFPPGTPPGRYTAYYRWAGYRDAVNIDVVPDDVRIPDTQRGRYGYFPRGAVRNHPPNHTPFHTTGLTITPWPRGRLLSGSAHRTG